MTKPNELYTIIGQIYDDCFPIFQSWCNEHQYSIKKQDITREPETEEGEVAFLWIFDELTLSAQSGDTLKLKILTVPYNFLESEQEFENAFIMTFTTFGYSDNGIDQNFLPVIFTQAEPKGFLAYLEQKKCIKVGNGLLVVTPNGML